jgi:hypothetical protein
MPLLSSYLFLFKAFRMNTVESIRPTFKSRWWQLILNEYVIWLAVIIPILLYLYNKNPLSFVILFYAVINIIDKMKHAKKYICHIELVEDSILVKYVLYDTIQDAIKLDLANTNFSLEKIQQRYYFGKRLHLLNKKNAIDWHLPLVGIWDESTVSLMSNKIEYQKSLLVQPKILH